MDGMKWDNPPIGSFPLRVTWSRLFRGGLVSPVIYCCLVCCLLIIIAASEKHLSLSFDVAFSCLGFGDQE